MNTKLCIQESILIELQNKSLFVLLNEINDRKSKRFGGNFPFIKWKIVGLLMNFKANINIYKGFRKIVNGTECFGLPWIRKKNI